MPWLLFIDKDNNILYEKIGIKEKEDNMTEIEYKIVKLMER